MPKEERDILTAFNKIQSLSLCNIQVCAVKAKGQTILMHLWPSNVDKYICEKFFFLVVDASAVNNLKWKISKFSFQNYFGTLMKCFLKIYIFKTELT